LHGGSKADIKVFIELEFQLPIVSVAMGITCSRVISAAKAKAARMSSVEDRACGP
jgi:hypothetical protein